MDVRPIGIFDSGSGGLSIFQSLIQLLPNESTIYFGDHRYMPYGEKTSTFIQKRAMHAIQFLLSRKVKLIVVACNAATVAGIDLYRQTFPGVPIIGVVPVIKTAAEVSKTKNILVLSTLSTAKSEYQKHLIQTFAPHCTVYSVGSSQLVRLVEEGKQNSVETQNVLETLMKPYKDKNIDTIVLGCTHFPFLRHLVRNVVGKDVHILDSGDAVSRHVARILEKENFFTDALIARHEFYTSGDTFLVKDIYANLLGKSVIVTSIDHFDTIN